LVAVSRCCVSCREWHVTLSKKRLKCPFSAKPPGGRLPMQDTDKPVALPPEKLRELAAWYRQFAERAGNPAILESRLRMATDLDQEAEQLIANAT